MINVDQLMLDLKQLREEMRELTKSSDTLAKNKADDDSMWNFHVGQADIASWSGDKIQNLIEKYS